MGSSGTNAGIVLSDGTKVTVVRKRVRNINLRVRPDGTVLVSASPRVPPAEVERFVRSREEWVARARERVVRQQEAHETHCLDGAPVLLWGARLTCSLVPSPTRGRHPSCTFGVEDATLRCCVDERIAGCGEQELHARDRALATWLRAEFVARANELLPDCERLVGRQAAGLRFRRMTSRWGSCNVQTGMVTLSTELVHYEERCLRYVIVHELCHLYEASHNEHFHALMDGFLPDWRETRRILNGRL